MINKMYFISFIKSNMLKIKIRIIHIYDKYFIFIIIINNIINNTIKRKKAKIGQILDITNKILYLLLLMQLYLDIITSR